MRIHKICQWLILLVTISALSQELDTKEKFTFRNIKFGPGLYVGGDEMAGVSLNLDVGFSKGVDIFTASVTAGGLVNRPFVETALLWGREVYLSKRFFLEYLLGLSYVNFPGTTDSFFTDQLPVKHAIGLPARVKIGYDFSDRFSIGYQGAINLNQQASIFVYSFFVQFSF